MICCSSVDCFLFKPTAETEVALHRHVAQVVLLYSLSSQLNKQMLKHRPGFGSLFLPGVSSTLDSSSSTCTHTHIHTHPAGSPVNITIFLDWKPEYFWKTLSVHRGHVQTKRPEAEWNRQLLLSGGILSETKNPN